MSALNIPFGAASTAKEVIAGVDLTGKRAIVTGASSGIGVETARALALAGAEVTLAVRDVEAGARGRRQLRRSHQRRRRLRRSQFRTSSVRSMEGVQPVEDCKRPLAVEAAKRWKTDGITVNALNPGRIGSTRLGRYMDATPASFDPNSKDVSYKNIEQGAATSVLLAASPLVEGVTGTYFEDCVPAVPHEPGVRRGVASYALDPEHAARLWQMSLGLIGQRPRGAASAKPIGL